MSIDRFDRLEKRLDEMQDQLDSILKMVAIGRGALFAAKVIGGVTSFFVAAIEIWRNFLRH